jgi:hypothetical protein
MNPAEPFRRYQELQGFVGWSDADAARVAAVAGLLDPHLPALVDDFYATIDRHPNARRVITGGAAQVERLKGTLLIWLRELLGGVYDAAYAARRWRVGWRHVVIGLDQVYTNARSTPTPPCRGCVPACSRPWSAPGRAQRRTWPPPCARSGGCSTSIWP